jgi:2-iminobutanoate/2-iminopropanoate deaminase
MVLKPVLTANAAPPGGHYSQAMIFNDLVFVSGILPIEPDGLTEPERDFASQAGCVLRNAAAILAAAKSSFADVVKTTVYITDISHWGEFNAIYAEHFGAHKPARAVVPVPTLHHGFLLEVEFIAKVTA